MKIHIHTYMVNMPTEKSKKLSGWVL
jgi:hypothetical protein